MNVLLIGSGRWGANHLRVLAQIGVTVWVADLSAERRRWAVGRGADPVRVVEDYRSVLDRVDAVDIVTPADSHLAIAVTCLRAGKHCFIEKPLTRTAAEGVELVALARETGRVVQVGHIFRFHPVTAALEAVLGIGRIGAVRYATCRFSGFKRPRTDVGVFQTDGIHYADLFRHLLRRDPTAVGALQRDFLGRGLDDFSVVTVHYDDVPIVIEANYFVPGTHRECVIVGEDGSLVADFGTGVVTVHAGEHRRVGEGWEAVDTGKEDVPTGQAEPLRLELEAFLDACAGLRPVPVTAADGLLTVEVAEAAAESARRSRVVTLAELRRAGA
jgi:UDP-N-acetylglucosamine 3-dehydrogenase